LNSKLLMSLVVLLATSRSQFARAADERSGNTLLKDCQAALDPNTPLLFSATTCMAYLQGLDDGESLKMLPPPDVSRTPYGPQWRQWCTPDNVTVGQMVRVVAKYLGGNPASLHEDKLLLVRRAFEDAWPCFKR